MNIDISKRSLAEQIKIIANIRQCSIKNLGEKFNEICGTNYSQQSFSRKLGKGNVNLNELQIISSILDFEVIFKPLEN